MNILFHTWDPGLTTDIPNSAGGSLWIRHLWQRLAEAGHQVVWAGEGEPSGVITKSAWEDLSDFVSQAHLAVFFWRWQMHEKYEERNRAHRKQNLLINLALDQGVPILVHDQDHKMTDDEIDGLLSSGVTLAAPELHPRAGYIKLLYPNPYSEFRKPKDIRTISDISTPDLIYVGNNYERWDYFERFFIKASEMGLKVSVYGNWMEPGPDRLPPEEVKALAPYIDFLGRIPQSEVINTLATAKATVHLAKHSYSKPGFITMRWCEAAVAGILGFVPHDFVGPAESPKVEFSKDIFWTLMNMPPDMYAEAVEMQQHWVRTNMRTKAWIDLFEELGK